VYCRFTYEAPHYAPRTALLSVKHWVERHRDECQSNVGVSPRRVRRSDPYRRACRVVGHVRVKAANAVRQHVREEGQGVSAFMMPLRHTTWPEKPPT
jgi:hypothetical protein